MSISSSGNAWNQNDELGIIRAVRTVQFIANTEEDATFLANLWGCIRRGKPIEELRSLVNEKCQ